MTSPNRYLEKDVLDPASPLPPLELEPRKGPVTWPFCRGFSVSRGGRPCRVRLHPKEAEAQDGFCGTHRPR